MRLKPADLVQDVLGVAGVLLIVAGVGLWSVPAALIVAGSCSLTIAMAMGWRASRDRPPAGP